MIEFAIRDTAGFARDRQITPEFTDLEPLWLLSWQLGAADGMLSHRRLRSREAARKRSMMHNPYYPPLIKRSPEVRAEPVAGVVDRSGEDAVGMPPPPPGPSRSDDDDLVAAALAAPVHGWDFGWLAGRAFGSDPTWSYPSWRVRPSAGPTTSSTSTPVAASSWRP